MRYFLRRILFVCLPVLFVMQCSSTLLAQPGPESDDFEHSTALKISQAVIGEQLGEYRLTGIDGQPHSLTDLRGKPLVISLIFTSCYQICPMTTRHLATMINKARDALGHDSFHVVTIGFDTVVDDPAAMRHFALQQGIENADWKIYSVNPEDVAALTADLGFIYFPSARGFDHIIQATLVDQEGIIYRQVYGQAFETPMLVEPLKQLVLGRPQPADTFMTSFFNRIKLFCTTYDPTRDSYRFDYSLFVGMFIGALIILLVSLWMLKEVRYRNRLANK